MSTRWKRRGPRGSRSTCARTGPSTSASPRLVHSVPLRSVYLTLIDLLARGLDDFAFEDDDTDAIAVHRELVAAIEAGEDERLDRALAAHMARSPLPGA